MKAKKLLIATAIVACTAGSALAEGPYVGVAGGVSIFHDSDITVSGFWGSSNASYDLGYGISAAVGYDFDPVRVEFDFGYRSAQVDRIDGVSMSGVDVDVMSYMVNAFYDFRNHSIVTPYIGGGIGLLHGEQEAYSEDYSANVFGYQAIAGVAFNLNKNFAVDLSYRFQGAGKDFYKDGVKVGYTSSNIFAGIRYTFN